MLWDDSTAILSKATICFLLLPYCLWLPPTLGGFDPSSVCLVLMECLLQVFCWYNAQHRFQKAELPCAYTSISSLFSLMTQPVEVCSRFLLYKIILNIILRVNVCTANSWKKDIQIQFFFLRVISESQVMISHTGKIFFSKIPHLKCWQRTTQPNNKPLSTARFKSSFKATIPFSIKKKLSNVKSSNKVQVHIKQSSVSAKSRHKASPTPEMILSWGDFGFCHGFGEPHHSVLVLSTDCVGA